MATTEQVQELIGLMQQQLQQLTSLQADNSRLRSSAGTVPRTVQSKKPDRPVVHTGLDDREWLLFEDTWSRYKAMVRLPSEDVGSTGMELRAACSADVNKLLFEFVGADTLNTCSEDELLRHIKSVSVKNTHKEVHRMSFGALTQNEGERITNYVARLKSKAFLCEFVVKCTTHDPPLEISYAEDMVSQRLVAGLSNHEHQASRSWLKQRHWTHLKKR